MIDRTELDSLIDSLHFSLSPTSGRTITDMAKDEYFDTLRIFDTRTIKRSVAHAKNWEKMPRPVELLALCRQFSPSDSADQKSQNDEPKATQDEIEVMVALIDEIMTWHRMRLVETVKPNCGSIDVAEWHRAGRPETWSPILTHFFSGYYSVFCRSLSGSDQESVEFCGKYVNYLRESRRKRTGEKK